MSTVYSIQEGDGTRVQCLQAGEPTIIRYMIYALYIDSYMMHQPFDTQGLIGTVRAKGFGLLDSVHHFIYLSSQGLSGRSPAYDASPSPVDRRIKQGLR